MAGKKASDIKIPNWMQIPMNSADFTKLAEQLADKQLERSSRITVPREGTKKSHIKKLVAEILTSMFARKPAGATIDFKISDLITDLGLKQSDRVMINDSIEDTCDENKWQGTERIGHVLLISSAPVDEAVVQARQQRRLLARQQARAHYAQNRAAKKNTVKK